MNFRKIKNIYIKKLMWIYGYQIIDIAEYLGISHHYVRCLMSGKLPCKTEYYQKLEKLLIKERKAKQKAKQKIFWDDLNKS